MLKKRLFGMMVLLVGIMLVFTVIGCDTGSNDATVQGELDGTWENGPFSLEIDGSNYVMKALGLNYGKGTVGYNLADGTFAIKSTHAWEENNWIDLVEECNGTLEYNGNNLTILTIDNSRYEPLTGTWEKKSTTSP